MSEGSLPALLDAPRQPRCAVVLAHGAGAGMQHPFMAALANGLAERGIATIRFQFPFMESGTRRPDPPAMAQAAVEAALTSANSLLPGLPLFAAGKSFGGRMATQLQAARPTPGLRGVVLFGFPLHPAGKPSTTRADHLAQVHCPMLFLQGTRDALADLDLLRACVDPLANAALHVVEGADHAFHVPVRSGRNDVQVIAELCDRAADWMLATAAAPLLPR